MYRVIWCFWRRDVKRYPIVTPMQQSENMVQSPNDVLGERRRQLTGIEPAMGCGRRWPNIESEFGGLGLHPLYEVHHRQVLNECWLAPTMVVEEIHVEDIF